MNDEKEKRPDPKVLNAVIVAYEMVKGVHHKPEKEDAEKGEKGAEDESTIYITICAASAWRCHVSLISDS